MRYDQLLEEVARHAGITRVDQRVRRDLRGVLYALGSLLPAPLRTRLAAQLPAPADTQALRAPDDPVAPVLAADELYQRTARRLDVPLGPALERAQVICLAVAEAIDLATRDQLVDAFGAQGEALFVEQAIPAARRGGAGRTIADGRPGSAHPISETSPRQRTTPHRHSVASTDNPHASRKLSSGGKPDDIAEGKSPR